MMVVFCLLFSAHEFSSLIFDSDCFDDCVKRKYWCHKGKSLRQSERCSQIYIGDCSEPLQDGRVRKKKVPKKNHRPPPAPPLELPSLGFNVDCYDGCVKNKWCNIRKTNSQKERCREFAEETVLNPLWDMVPYGKRRKKRKHLLQKLMSTRFENGIDLYIYIYV
jgi:hypothetical protein